MKKKLFVAFLCLNFLIVGTFSAVADAAVVDVVRIKTPFLQHTIFDVDGNYTEVIFDAKNNTIEVKEKPNSRVFAIDAEEKKKSKYEIDPSISYSDLEDHWARDDVLLLASIGLLKGYPDGTFRPNNIITRAEFATLLTRALELEQEENLTPLTTSNFQDVNENHWFFDSVVKLEANKNLAVKYYGDAKLNPNEPIPREEIALWIKSELPSTEEKISFIDQKSVTYVEEVNQAVVAGILKGYPDGDFKPRQGTTRAEAATLVVRILYLKEVL